MTTYFIFGKYSLDSIQKISAQRTSEATALAKLPGISFTTDPAISMADFDKLVGWNIL
jgi:hypothetical protein